MHRYGLVQDWNLKVNFRHWIWKASSNGNSQTSVKELWKLTVQNVLRFVWQIEE